MYLHAIACYYIEVVRAQHIQVCEKFFFSRRMHSKKKSILHKNTINKSIAIANQNERKKNLIHSKCSHNKFIGFASNEHCSVQLLLLSSGEQNTFMRQIKCSFFVVVIVVVFEVFVRSRRTVLTHSILYLPMPACPVPIRHIYEYTNTYNRRTARTHFNTQLFVIHIRHQQFVYTQAYV